MKLRAVFSIASACCLTGGLAFATKPAHCQTQYQLDQQAAASFAVADKELNAAYNKILKSSDATGAARLKSSEKAWLTFRDAEAKYECSLNEGGSIYPMVYDDALASLTEERTKQLKGDAAALAPH
jgi:uncharacterized protein YecT (DUF1311 family)